MNHLLFHPPWSLLSPSQKLAKSHNENRPVVMTEDVCTKRSPHQEIPTASSIYHTPFNFLGLWRPPYAGTTVSISPNLWPVPHFDQDGLLTSPYTFLFTHNSKTLLILCPSPSAFSFFFFYSNQFILKFQSRYHLTWGGLSWLQTIVASPCSQFLHCHLRPRIPN